MLENRLLQSIKILLYIILFVPAVVTYSTVYPFLHGKVFWIEIFAEILLGLYLILILINKNYLPRRTPLFWAVSAFISALLISTIFSVDRSISFWGDWSRMTGLVLYLHLFIFFIVFSSVIKEDRARRNYLIFFTFLGTLLSVFAWIQRYNTKFLKAVWVGSRVGSTLDNPAFFAIFLIFIIFVSLWLALSVSKKYQLLFLFFAVFNFITIFITQTRGVIVGIFVGAAIFASSKVLSGSVKWKIGALIVLVLIPIIFYFKTPTFANLPGVGRILESTLTDSTIQTRLMAWQIAWRAWTAQPITGWGHEAFYAAFNKFYNPEFIRYSFAETWFDKAHNIFFDLLSTSGVLGLASFLVIFICGFLVVRKNLHMSAQMIYLAFVVAYLISNFFEFDTPSSLLALFFVFAMINSDAKNANSMRMMRIRPSSIAVIAIFTGLLLWFVPVKSILASRALDRAGDVMKHNFEQGSIAYREIISKNARFSEPAALEYATHLNQLILKDEAEIQRRQADFDLVMKKLEDGIRRHRYDVNYVLAYGVLANTLAISQPDFARKAEELLERSRKLVNPNRQQVLLLLGETKLLLDKTDEAIAILKLAQDLAPTNKIVSYRLAIAYFSGGFEREGMAQLKKARLLGMTDIGAQPLLVLISVNATKGNWSKVAELYEEAVKLEPQNAKLYAQMATAYATIGNKYRAREAVLRAIELDPKLKIEGEQFLRQLK